MSFLPPGVTSGSLAGFPLISYWNTAIMEWQANTPALAELCDFKPLPRRSGRAQQFYGQRPFTSSTQTISEGIPPSSEALSQVTSDVFADEFGNWIGISNIVNMMFINDGVSDATRNLAYQAALSGNQLAFNAFDTDATANAVARIDLGDNEFLLSSTLRKTEAQLVGNNVPPRDNGMYTTVLTSFMSYDLISDNTAGGWTDVAKRTAGGYTALVDGQVRSFQVGEWSGHRIIRTSTVSTFANYPSNGKTGYGAYTMGREAFLASNLTGIEVPKSPSFNVMVQPLTTPDLSNPMMQTRCICAYDFFLGLVGRPNTNGTSGYRRVRGEVSAV